MYMYMYMYILESQTFCWWVDVGSSRAVNIFVYLWCHAVVVQSKTQVRW